MKKIINILSIMIFLLITIISMPSFADDKTTIAIGEIKFRAQDSSENKRYRAYGNAPREDTRAFADMLTTALVKTRKFNVIERNRMAEILKEQGMSVEGIANGGYESEGFNLRGVDYIFTGSITEYGEIAKGSNFAGISTAKKEAKMALDVRILDVSNGSIIIAETVSVTMKGGSGFAVDGIVSTKSDSGGALLGAVMRQTSIDISNLVVSTIFPIKVIAITKDNIVMLNYGEGLLKTDHVLNVFSQGESFSDPDTGEILGSEEKLIAKIAVISTHDKFSKAQIIDEYDSIEKGMLVRLTNETPNKKKKKRKKLY